MAPKFALFTKGSKLLLNKGFKNMFELLQFCAQPSKCYGILDPDRISGLVISCHESNIKFRFVTFTLRS